MRLKALKMTVAALLFQALLFGPALAQDFDSLMAGATSANQLWVEQIDSALEAGDLATLQARTATAVATGEQVASLLMEALAVAPDDASRSRAEGVLTHVTAALQAGRAALQASEFDRARSQVDAMRGEAEEALSELVPFASAPAPVTLPAAGNLAADPSTGGLAAGLIALSGALSILAGLGLRRRFA